MTKSQTVQGIGMNIFTIVWLGQVVSLVGSGLTNFALSLTLKPLPKNYKNVLKQ